MTAQLAFDFSSGARRRTGRPAGPFPIVAGSVRWPIVDRFSPDGIGWTIVDANDYALAASRLWRVETAGYVICYERRGAARVRVALHNLVLAAPLGLVVDHREGNRLDNRRAALRLVTRSQNAANVRLDRRGRSSCYRGVTLHRQTGRWQAAAHHYGRCYYAGLFEREEDAARARDALAATLWPGIVPANVAPLNPSTQTRAG